MTTATYETTLTTINCGECGGVYAINERYRKQRANHGGFWNCPYCQCSWGYAREGSKVERLKRDLEQRERALCRERASHDQTRTDLEHTERRRRSEKAAKTRIKNRIGKGVCPCCNRSFANLARHMQSQHPEYSEETSCRA